MDATTLLQNFGGWALGGIALIIFIESGVLFVATGYLVAVS